MLDSAATPKASTVQSPEGPRLASDRPSFLGWLIAGVAAVALVAWLGWHGTMAPRHPTAPAPGTLSATNSAPAAGPARGQPPSSTDGQTAGPTRPSFDIVRVSPQGEAVMAGRAAPDAQVTINAGNKPIGQVQADQNGQWVFVPDKPLTAGGQQLTLSAMGPDGQTTQGTSDVVVVVPGHPQITGNPATQPAPAKLAQSAPNPAAPNQAAGGAPAQQLAAAAPPMAILNEGDAAPRVLQGPPPAPGAPASAPFRLGMDAVEYDQRGDIRFGGAAPPHAPVRVYVDNKPVGDAVANAQGRWSLTPGSRVTAGKHTLRADQLDLHGHVVARIELPFQRVELSQAQLGDGRVVIQPGENLWRIARAEYGHGIRYTVIYQANRDQIRDPNLIYSGQTFTLPTALGQATHTATGAAAGAR
jgi:nucleoid-associated protein YgaU